MKLQVEYVPITEIKPYRRNAKLHPQEQIEQIKNSMQEFGNIDPIGVWHDEIVEGHGRYEALKQMGAKEIPIIRLDDLTDEQRKAYALVHNKLTMNSDFDLALLDTELAEIETIDMTLLGFDDKEEETPQEVVEDEFDEEPPEEPTSKLGDIYQLGNHRLMCGDSTNAEHVAKLMDGAKADMVFTDPPYGYTYQSNERVKSPKFDVIENDDKILDFFPIITNWCDGFIFICTAWKCIDKWLPLFRKYLTLTNMIIWDKGGGGIGDLKKTFITDFEIILCANNEHEITGKRIGSVWKVGKDAAGSYIHPTQKPVKLPAIAIENTTNSGAICLDLFGGSGSTLIACEQTNRRCFMMEISPEYCDVILQRYINFKGSNADVFLLKDGKRIPYSEVV